MLLGVLLFAVGTGFYAAASLGRGSYEALTFSLAEKNGWQVKVVRMILDIVMVIAGVLLGGNGQRHSENRSWNGNHKEYKICKRISQYNARKESKPESTSN